MSASDPELIPSVQRSIGETSHGHDFPNKDTKRPHIAQSRKFFTP